MFKVACRLPYPIRFSIWLAAAALSLAVVTVLDFLEAAQRGVNHTIEGIFQ